MVNVWYVYGDWNSILLLGWIGCLYFNVIWFMQQFVYIKGKNVIDFVMIIDVMDLLYSKNVEVFVLMISDSDFILLVMRILESGFLVYGFGEKKILQFFVDVCFVFIYIENLIEDEDSVGKILVL